MISPTELEHKYTNFTEKIVDKVSKLKSFYLFFLSIYLGFVYFTFNLWTQFYQPNWSRFFIAQDRYWAGVFLIFAGFLAFPLASKIKKYILPFIVITSFLFPLWKIDSLKAVALLPFIYIALGSFIARRKGIHSWFRVLFLFILLAVFYLILAKDLIMSQSPTVFRYLAIIHFEGAFLYFSQIALSKNPLSVEFDFNPLQLYSPLPIPQGSTFAKKRSEETETFVKGGLELIFSNLIFVFLILLLRNLPPWADGNLFIQYLSFLLMVTAIMKMLNGFLGIFGFSVQPAVHFLFLAKSPIETWQRGSVFIAKFIFDYIYFPTWKRFRNSVVPSLASIAFIITHLFIFHDEFINRLLGTIFPVLASPMQSTLILGKSLIWVLTWLFWIGFHHLIFKISLNQFSRSSWHQWLSILFTHWGNIFVLPFSQMIFSLVVSK